MVVEVALVELGVMVLTKLGVLLVEFSSVKFTVVVLVTELVRVLITVELVATVLAAVEALVVEAPVVVVIQESLNSR